MTRRLLAATAVAFATAAIVVPTTASAGGFCADPSAFSSAETTEVDIKNFCFVPAVAYVDTGATVTFTNYDSEIHNLGGVNNVFGDLHDALAPGKSVSYTFDEEGTFPYLCILHPGMAGAIVVGDGRGDSVQNFAAGVANPAEPPAESGEVAVDATSTRASGSGTPAWIVVSGILLGLGVLGLAAIPRRRAPSIG